MFYSFGYTKTTAPDFNAILGGTEHLILYEQDFFKFGEDRTLPIPPANIIEVQQRIKDSPANYIMCDVESWLSLYGQAPDEQTRDEIMLRYANLCLDVRRSKHSVMVSHYNGFPAFAKSDILTSLTKYQELIEKTSRRPMWIQNATFISPVLYTGEPLFSDWEKLARKIIGEARVSSGGKPVIPYYSGLYKRNSPADPNDGLRLMPGGYFYRGLELLQEICDGIIIWHGNDNSSSNGDWNSEIAAHSWWSELQAWHSESRPKRVGP